MALESEGNDRGAISDSVSDVPHNHTPSSRERIISAARAEVEGKGILGLRVQDVAQQAKVSVPLIYKYYVDRDGLLAEFGAQVWPRLVPLNELRVDDKPPVLDAIQFSIRGKLAFAVLVELQASLLGQILNDLGECWKSKPSEDTLNQTAGLLLAMVKLVERVHARGRSYGG